MAYGIIGAGQETKRQALSGLDEAARLEQRNQMARDAREQAKTAQRSQMVGMVGGVAADRAVGYGMDRLATKKAAQEFGRQGAQQTLNIGTELAAKNVAAANKAIGNAGMAITKDVTAGAVQQAANTTALAAPGTVAGTTAAAAPGAVGAATTGAAAAGTGAAATGAAGGAAATGAAAGAGGASASAGVLGAMGPAGWMALAGLLAFSIFD